MQKMLLYLLLPVIFAQFFAFAPAIPAVRADGPTDISNQEGFGSGGQIPSAFGAADSPRDPRAIVANIIKVVLGLIGIIFVTLLIYAGFKWMTAAGNGEQVEEAKKQIGYAVVGLIIVLSAYGITVFITKAILSSATISNY